MNAPNIKTNRIHRDDTIAPHTKKIFFCRYEWSTQIDFDPSFCVLVFGHFCWFPFFFWKQKTCYQTRFFVSSIKLYTWWIKYVSHHHNHQQSLPYLFLFIIFFYRGSVKSQYMYVYSTIWRIIISSLAGRIVCVHGVHALYVPFIRIQNFFQIFFSSFSIHTKEMFWKLALLTAFYLVKVTIDLFFCIKIEFKKFYRHKKNIKMMNPCEFCAILIKDPFRHEYI